MPTERHGGGGRLASKVDDSVNDIVQTACSSSQHNHQPEQPPDDRSTREYSYHSMRSCIVDVLAEVSIVFLEQSLTTSLRIFLTIRRHD